MCKCYTQELTVSYSVYSYIIVISTRMKQNSSLIHITDHASDSLECVCITVRSVWVSWHGYKVHKTSCLL